MKETFEEAKQRYLQRLRTLSPQQPKSWYLAQLARQPFVQNPKKYGYEEAQTD